MTHINEDNPSFFFQKYLIALFIGVFIKFLSIILIPGIVNILLLLNIFASYEETYYIFFFWFELSGVTTSNISHWFLMIPYLIYIIIVYNIIL